MKTDTPRRTAIEISDLFEKALEHSCTCNVDENSCKHCNAWEYARRELERALSDSAELERARGADKDAERYRWWCTKGFAWLQADGDGLAGLAFCCQTPTQLIEKGTEAELANAVADYCIAQAQR